MQAVERQILEMVDARRFEEARAAALRLREAGGAWERLSLFLLSQVELRLGNPAECVRLLLEARRGSGSWGEHISVLSNLTAAYYLLDRPIEWRRVLGELRQVYGQV